MLTQYTMNKQSGAHPSRPMIGPHSVSPRRRHRQLSNQRADPVQYDEQTIRGSERERETLSRVKRGTRPSPWPLVHYEQTVRASPIGANDGLAQRVAGDGSRRVTVERSQRSLSFEQRIRRVGPHVEIESNT